MANPSPNRGDAFDLKKIRELVALMNDQGLSEIDLRKGPNRVRLRKGVLGTAAPAPVTVPAPAARPAAADAPRGDDHLVIVKSPMVGTFYGAPSPDAAPFVKVGDHVGPDTTICIIEAMKVFNEIPAETKGQIAAVLVESGAPVEFGQPLFKVDPRT